MFLMAYGAMIAYHIVIGDTVPKVVDSYINNITSPWDSRPFIVILFSCLIMLPLSLYKHIASLSITSFLSLTAVFFIILSVIIEAPSTASKDDINYNNLSFIRSTWFAGAGTMAFAFVCHHSTFIVYNSLYQSNMKQWKIVSNISVGLALLLSLVLSLAGYLAFRDNVESDILNNFSNNNHLINIARILLAITMVFTFPIEQFVARHCVLELLEANALIKSSKSTQAHYIITFMLWGTALAIGASFDNVGFVLELDGAFAASVLAFIMPGFIVLKANPERLEKKSSLDFIMPVMLIVFGFLVMVLGTVSTFLS